MVTTRYFTTSANPIQILFSKIQCSKKNLSLKLEFTLNFFSSSLDLITNLHKRNKIKLLLEFSPQALTHTVLLPFIIHEDKKHPFFIDPTKLHVPYFEIISFDSHFLAEHSGTSDSRPNTSSDTNIENSYYIYETTTPDAEQFETLQDSQDTFHDAHEVFNELVEPTQPNQTTVTLDHTSTVPDETNTNKHEIIADTHSFAVTSVSKILITPTRQTEHNANDNETTSKENDFSVINTQNTTTIQLQTFSQVICSYDSPNMKIIQHITQTQSPQTPFRTPSFSPAQTPNVQPSTFTINTIHSIPQTCPITSRTLSRPPVILNKPLSYNLASTNAKNVQQPIQPSASLSQPTSFRMNSLSTSQVAQVP